MDYLKIIGTVLYSIGGAGTIIFALSSFLSKIWVNKIIQNEKYEYEKQLNQFKQEFAIELVKVKSRNDKVSYITKSQYDLEFNIYQEIWAAIIELTDSTTRLYPSGMEDVPISHDELMKYNKNKIDNFIASYNSFMDMTKKYAPFYQENFYEEFIEFYVLCNKVFKIFKRYNFDKYFSQSLILVRDTMDLTEKEYEFVYKESHQQIKIKYDYLLKGIRDYLNSLIIVQN